ncbi:MAG: CAP domain-containing protein [Patescibacteria group bacterium]
MRSRNVRNIVAVILFLELVIFLIPTLTRINMTGGMAAVLPAVLSDLTNQERQSQNLTILKINQDLNKAAEMKAIDMATLGYFAHTSPEGKTPWYWIEKVGYKYQYAGENLAINFSDSKDVTNAWMASPTHKSNIVKGNYTEVGTGIASGIYEGQDTVFVAQIYANPLPKIEVQIEPTQKETRLNDSFGQVKKIGEIPKIVTVPESVNVLGVETNVPNADIQISQNPQSTFLQKLLASPRNTTNIILYIIFGIIVIALLLYIIIKTRDHHLDLITNGLIVLAILGAIFVVNYQLSYRDMVITQSLDYSNENI